MSSTILEPGSTKSARERVVRYLLAEFERLDLEEGGRLPPTRTLAKSLNVSLSTVQAAFRELVERGTIRTEIGNGSFLVSKPRTQRDEYRVAFSFPAFTQQNRSSWSGLIAESILNSASACDKHLTFFAMNCQGAGKTKPETVRAFVSQKMERADALILLPHPHADLIRSLFEEAGKTVVCYNAPYLEATTNFVSPDYYQSSLKLAETWKSLGRKNIVLITFGRVKNSVSALQRSLGILAGLGPDINRSISYRVEEVPDTRIKDGYDCAKKLFSGKDPHPDAIYCIGDLLGLGVLKYLKEKNINCPMDVSVVGGSGTLVGLDGLQLTSIRQPFELVGDAATSLLLQCLGQAGKLQPAVYLPCSLRTGASTTAEENSLLDKAFSSHSSSIP